jgi:peptide/nickel transport system permease protein
MSEMPSRLRKNSPMREVWRRLKKNKLSMFCLGVIIALLLVAILGSLITPYNYAAQDLDNTLLPPSFSHPFGTDNFGRDTFSRILYGARYTIFIGFFCITVSAVIAIPLGLIAAYYHKLDNLIMRAMDVIIGMPSTPLLLVLIAALGIGLGHMIIALIVVTIPGFARVTRSQAMVVKNQDFIEASVAIGASSLRILLRHILPNSMAPLIIQFTLGTGFVVLESASLSFVGMGVQAPHPEWGLMISTGRAFLRTSWYLSIMPGLAIMTLTFALNYLGDGLRDAMDPRLNK